MLPSFDERGLLPIGDYTMTFAQLRASFLVAGGQNCEPNWNVERRAYLVNQLEKVVRPLWQVGIARVFVAGSFVENVPEPGDMDGYFECDATRYHFGHLERELKALGQPAPEIWNWSLFAMQPGKNNAPKPLMWHRYQVELYPHHPGLMSGLTDRYGRPQDLATAFRLSTQELKSKGLILLQRD